MLFVESKFNIADNSGVKTAKCIKVLGGSKRKVAKLSEVIICAVQKRDFTKFLSKSKVHPALVINSCKKFRRKNGSFIKFNNNSALLLSSENLNLFATRIYVPIIFELRKNKESFLKILSLSKKIV